VTEYEVSYKLSVARANPIRVFRVNESTTSTRISNLIPGVSYTVVVRAFIDELSGTPTNSVLKTSEIGEGLGRAELTCCCIG